MPLNVTVVVIFLILAAASVARAIIRGLIDWRVKRDREIDPGIHERLARLESGFEGLAVEHQRLLEGHRFLTELLANRPAHGQIAANHASQPQTYGAVR